MNALCLRSLPVTTTEMDLKQAQEEGALAFFEDKYEDRVRVVSVGTEDHIASKEVCGGTHVAFTSALYPFKIVSEKSVAVGTRRLSAVAGPAAVSWLWEQQEVSSRCKCGYR